MSKKPKKHSKHTKHNNSTKKGGNRVKSVAAFKGVIISVAKKHGFVRNEESGEDFFVSGRDLLGAVPGDTVLCEKSKTPANKQDVTRLNDAKVVKIVKPSDNVLVGTVVETDIAGALALIPDSFGSREPLQISGWGKNRLKAGDKVSFTLKSRGAKHHLHVVDITGVFGSSQSAKVCVYAYLEEKGIARAFSEQAEEEAQLCGQTVDPAEIPHRLDLREMPIFTIDGADTKDIDDAINIERTESGYRLGVHIADVSHYVTPASRLNQEAFERGTSVYIADLVVPMLPKALSNGICSLNPQVDRLAFSCLMEVAKSGELKSFEFKKTVIRSRIQGVYSEINAYLKTVETGDLKDSDIDDVAEKSSTPTEALRMPAEVLRQLPIMLELAATLKKNREGRDAPALDSPECKIICNADGSVADIKRRESGENAVSEGIIEEFMLLANNAAARLAMENDLPFVYRIHEPPAEEKLTRLSETLAGLGIVVPPLEATAESFSKVLRAVKESDPEKFDVVNMAVLRGMMKAKYSHEPLGHFGLVMGEYAHFTSPIRRYPDLSIHRILSWYTAQKEGKGKIPSFAHKFAHDSAQKSTQCELRAVSAERDCNKFYYAEYMAPRIGEVFDGTVTGVTDASIFVMLENTVEGRVCFRGIGDGFGGAGVPFDYVSDGVSLSNAVTGVRYTLGDKVRVKCVGCSIPLGLVDFEIGE